MSGNWHKTPDNSTNGAHSIDRVLGAGPLDAPITFTFFGDVHGTDPRERRLSLSKLLLMMNSTTADAKDRLPLFNGVVFGNRATDRGALRNDNNANHVEAIVVDYDGAKAGGREITPEEAAAACRDAGLAALVVTTPSHGRKGNRWRAVFPLSRRLDADEHGDLVARVNGVLWGALASESFVLSQSYFFGKVGEMWSRLVEGDYLDEADHLDRDAIGRPRRGDAEAAPGARTGLDADELRAALMSIPNDGSRPEHDSRDWWLKMLAGIHFETRGSPEGLELAQEWSALWTPGYDAEKTDDAWRSFRRTDGVASGEVIVREAREHGWRDPRVLALMDRLMPDITDPIILDAKPLGAFALDENGVINAFTDRHAEELKFDHDAGRWFVFDGNLWRPEGTKLALVYARDVSTTLAKRDAKAKPLNKVSSWEAVERGARTVREFAVKSDAWNRDLMLLGTPGGVVDLRTGNLRPGRSEDMISRSTAVAPIPLDVFDPKRDCPLWRSFLDEALDGDADAIRLIQQWGGYCLTGDTREEKLVFVYGPGGSGKSTTVETIGKLMGDYATTIATEAFKATKFDRHPTEIAALRGARLVWASETEKGQQWAENRIKQWTGGDTLKARFMRQDEFTFVPEFKLSVVGNNRPTLKDVDTAMTRRLLVIPFDHPPARKDAALKDKLKAEWPGILAWLIRGCLDWQRHGLVRPAIVDKATDEYFVAQDVFGRWLEDCCEVDRGFAETTAALWDSWARYAHDEGVEPGSKTATFPETLSQRGFIAASKVGRSRGRGYKGLRLSDDDRSGTGRDR